MRQYTRCQILTKGPHEHTCGSVRRGRPYHPQGRTFLSVTGRDAAHSRSDAGKDSPPSKASDSSNRGTAAKQTLSNKLFCSRKRLPPRRQEGKRSQSELRQNSISFSIWAGSPGRFYSVYSSWPLRHQYDQTAMWWSKQYLRSLAPRCAGSRSRIVLKTCGSFLANDHLTQLQYLRLHPLLCADH